VTSGLTSETLVQRSLQRSINVQKTLKINVVVMLFCELAGTLSVRNNVGTIT
jgi:hypothetical protein